MVVCAIIWKDSQILLCMKPHKQGPYPDTGHLPGGKVNQPDLRSAIRREIMAETGLHVNHLTKVAWDTDTDHDPSRQ